MSSPPTMGTGASSCSVATLMPHAYPNPDGCGDASELRRFPHVRRVKPSDVSLERDQPGYCGDLSSTDLPEPDACHLLPVGPAVRSCVHQDLCLLPVSDQGMGQLFRLCETPRDPGGYPVRRSAD